MSHKYQSTYTLHRQTFKEVVDGSKHLGATVTYNLSWSKYVSDTAGKAHRSMGFLLWTFKHCSRQVKAATYISVVRPVLEYSSPVWDSYVKALEQVQHLISPAFDQAFMHNVEKRQTAFLCLENYYYDILDM